MADDGYYGDQPHFQRKDPLTAWSYVFLASAVVATAWLLLLLWLMSSNRLPSDTSALGLEQTTWVLVTVIVLVAALVGTFFIIVARIGAGQAGSYLSADVADDEAPAVLDEGLSDEAEDIVEQGETERLIASTHQERTHHAARIEQPFGPDGRLVMSYTVPEAQPRGVYGDTYVLVEQDQVLNIKTLLAKTLRDT